MNNNDHQFSQVKNVNPYNNMISTETSGFEIYKLFFFCGQTVSFTFIQRLITLIHSLIYLDTVYGCSTHFR